MNNQKMKRALIDVGKDVLIAFTIVCIAMLALYAYCGIWPPMVVVESGSMMRYDEKSVIGVIDTGDMVFVKKVNGVDDVVTYVDGEASGYSRYGTFGDVIIYRPNGLSEREDGTAVVPIIHRSVLWLELNETAANPDFDGIDYLNITFDVPSLGMYGTREVITLPYYGFWQENVTINLDGIMVHYEGKGAIPHGGYITMGDNNVPFYDQPISGLYEPILPEWIVGKAIGEIPWFGLIKLKVTGSMQQAAPRNSWTGLFVTIFLLLFIPFILDLVLPRLKKRKLDGRETSGTGECRETEVQAEPETVAPGGPKPVEDAKAPDDIKARERVVIVREIVRIPCPYCHVLVENTDVKCPHCGGVIR
jgi:signal peptidase